MKKLAKYWMLLVAFCLAAAPLYAQEIKWNLTSKVPKTLGVSTTTDGGAPGLSLTYNEGKPAWSLFSGTFTAPGSKAEGISFEVKGDGSQSYVGICLGYTRLNMGYEAIFPLSSTDWQKVVLRWDDFAQNRLPWDPKITEDDSTPVVDPGRINLIGFGCLSVFRNFYPEKYAYQIRNIALVDHIPDTKIEQFSKGFSHTRDVLKKGGPLKILLLGDSITEFAKENSYGYFCGLKLKEAFGSSCTVANCGIGGHSIRAGKIILPRSLRTMPEPDLVCIMFGANDCKATEFLPGYTENDFKREMNELIDKVRKGTGGKADIVLLNGVPILNADRMASSGKVEKIVNAVRNASQEKQTAFVDTFDAYLKSDPNKRIANYAAFPDTVHQSTAGHEFIGNLLFEAIRASMAGSAKK